MKIVETTCDVTIEVTGYELLAWVKRENILMDGEWELSSAQDQLSPNLRDGGMLRLYLTLEEDEDEETKEPEGSGGE